MRPYSNVFAKAQSHGEEVYENINPLAYRQMILDCVGPVIVLFPHFKGEIFMLAQSIADN